MDTMLSKALREFMTGPLRQLIVNLGGEDGAEVEEEFNKFNRREPCWVPAPTGKKISKPVLLKPRASGVSIAAAPAVKTADCFKVGDGVFVHRDSDFDRWLPTEISAVGPGNASTFELTKELNFKEIADAHLVLNGATHVLKEALIEREKCWSLKQIEDVIRGCEKGNNPLKLWVDPKNFRANLFPTAIGGDVFVVNAYRYSHGWRVNLYEFCPRNGHMAGFLIDNS